MKKKSFLFVIGSFRAGKKVVGSILDGTKNVLVLPNEFSFFYLFWFYISSNILRDKKPNFFGLKQNIIHHFNKNYNFKKKKNFNFLLFQKKILELENKENSIEFLYNIFDVYLHCLNVLKKKYIKYYCLVTPSTHFDFNNNYLSQYEHKFIVLKRNFKKSILSMRYRVLKKSLGNINSGYKNFLYGEEQKNFIKLSLRYSFDIFFENFLLKKKTLKIFIINLQKNTKNTLSKLVKFIEIKNEKKLFVLTRFHGQNYSGNLNDRSKNLGYIAKKPTANIFPLNYFENEIIKIFSENIKLKKMKISFHEILYMVFLNFFFLVKKKLRNNFKINLIFFLYNFIFLAKFIFIYKRRIFIGDDLKIKDPYLIFQLNQINLMTKKI
jgi:hypothetical protein